MSDVNTEIDPLHKAIYDRLSVDMKLEILLAAHGASVINREAHDEHQNYGGIQVGTNRGPIKGSDERSGERGIALYLHDLPPEGSPERAQIQSILDVFDIKKHEGHEAELSKQFRGENSTGAGGELNDMLDQMLEARRLELAKGT